MFVKTDRPFSVLAETTTKVIRLSYEIASEVDEEIENSQRYARLLILFLYVVSVAHHDLNMTPFPVEI